MFVTSAYAQEAAPAEEGHTEVPGEAEHGGFPPFESHTFPSQILWLVICFGLFYLFLQRVIMPRIGNILNVRSGRIQQDLAEARKKAGTIGQQARDAAKAEADAKRKETEGALEKKLADAEASIAAVKSAALKEVGTIAESTASAIVEHLVGKADKGEIAAAVKSAWR